MSNENQNCLAISRSNLHAKQCISFFRAFKEKPHIILCMYLGVYKDVYVYNQCKGIKPAITRF